MTKAGFVFLFAIFITPLELFAAKAPIAKVIKIRGAVTKLLPGATQATLVQEGDELLEDTSIVTGEKSFIKIKFIDKSELNMGPESKIVIAEMSPSEQVGIISLLKGRIRTEVEKREKGQEEAGNKFYIRTRTAALGVRGTDFQTIYNPENRMTSLLTYQGSVAMARVDENTHQRFSEGETKVVRDDVTKVPEIQKVPGKLIDEKAELKKILATSEVVLVPPGQSSFSSSALKKTSLPVRISPVQLNALYKNKEFSEKNAVNLKLAANDTEVKALLPQAPQKAPVEGFYDEKTGDFAPKAGGFIDEHSGLYVAPEEGAKFDAKSGVYVSSKNGDIDADTGQYVAPKGLVLDPQKGFVLSKEAEVKPELLALKEDLNRSIARDVVVGDLDGEVVATARGVNEKFIRNRLEVAFSVSEEKIKIEGSDEIKSESRPKVGLNWQLSSTNRFSPQVGVSYSAAHFNDLKSRGYTQDSKALFEISFGLKYALTNRVDLMGKVQIGEAHYATRTSLNPDRFDLKRVAVTKLILGAEAYLMHKGRFALVAEVLGGLGLRKRLNNDVASGISDLSGKLFSQYLFTNYSTLSLGPVFSRESFKFGNGLVTNDEVRTRYGLELKYAFNY